MLALESEDIQCPFCWQWITVAIDCSVAQQEYIEDCQICCRPLVLRVEISDDESIDVQVRGEND